MYMSKMYSHASVKITVYFMYLCPLYALVNGIMVALLVPNVSLFLSYLFCGVCIVSTLHLVVPFLVLGSMLLLPCVIFVKFG